MNLHRKSQNVIVGIDANPAMDLENKSNSQRHVSLELIKNSGVVNNWHKRNRPNLIWKEWSKRWWMRRRGPRRYTLIVMIICTQKRRSWMAKSQSNERSQKWKSECLKRSAKSSATFAINRPRSVWTSSLHKSIRQRKTWTDEVTRVANREICVGSWALDQSWRHRAVRLTHWIQSSLNLDTSKINQTLSGWICLRRFRIITAWQTKTNNNSKSLCVNIKHAALNA